jgi:hypothetical protein
MAKGDNGQNASITKYTRILSKPNAIPIAKKIGSAIVQAITFAVLDVIVCLSLFDYRQTPPHGATGLRPFRSPWLIVYAIAQLAKDIFSGRPMPDIDTCIYLSQP